MAQDEAKIVSYTTDDGLPQSSVWGIVQDRRGFLWIGTSDGVCRFDGYNFTTYRDTANEQNFTAYVKFYKDDGGHIWTISQTALCLYDEEKDRFITVFKSPGQVTWHYNGILGEDKQYVFVGITGYGLIKADKRTLKTHAIDLKTTSGIAAMVAGAVHKDEIWVAGDEHGSYIYNTVTGKLDTLLCRPLSVILNYNDSELVSVSPNIIYLFHKNTHTQQVISVQMPEGNWAITGIKRISDTELQIATGVGLICIDTKLWKMVRHIKSFNKEALGPPDYIQCMYTDRSGNTWIGTNGDGLKKIKYRHKCFRHYVLQGRKESLVKAIYADGEHVYVGYFRQGIGVFDKHARLQKMIPVTSTPAIANSVYAFYPLDSTRLMFLTGEINGIGMYDRRTIPKNISSLFMRAFHEDVFKCDGTPFFCTSGNRVYTAKEGACIISVDPNAQNLDPRKELCVPGQIFVTGYTAKDGVMWLGSMNGAYYVKDGRPVKIDLQDGVHVKSINEDLSGNIWLATTKGIYVLKNYKVVQHYAEGKGLANQFVYGLLRDHDGNMWFSHNKGLSVYRTATKSFRHYDHDDGLQSNEFNTGAYFKAADGELFFGGINGVNSFYPADIKDNHNIPVASITSIKLFDMPMQTDTAYWNIRAVVLPYTQNSLSFEFAALEFTDPAKNQYAYMMAGVDKNWINAGDRRFARYAGLAPGSYVFKVKASNDDGIWQQVPTTMVINIVPPFWQSLWFKALMAVIAIAFTFAIAFWVQRRRHRRMVRAMELQQRIQAERQRISRDLHDTVGTQLSLISNNIEWVVRPLRQLTEKEKEEKLQFVNHTARDIISTLRETIWALNKQEITLEEFADKLKAYIQKQLAVHPEIMLDIHEQITNGAVLGPSEALNLFRICQEATANVLKYAKASKLTVRIASINAVYNVSVEDNGVGFDMGAVDPAVQNGLENMRYRAEDMHCVLEIESVPGEGTRVTIMKNEAFAVF